MKRAEIEAKVGQAVLYTPYTKTLRPVEIVGYGYYSEIKDGERTFVKGSPPSYHRGGTANVLVKLLDRAGHEALVASRDLRDVDPFEAIAAKEAEKKRIAQERAERKEILLHYRGLAADVSAILGEHVEVESNWYDEIKGVRLSVEAFDAVVNWLAAGAAGR